MLRTILTILQVLTAFVIVALVLLQRGKGADAGAGFGAGASGTVFGARGSATFFSKLTAILATLFFVTSMSLAWFATRPRAEVPKSIVDELPKYPLFISGVTVDAFVSADVPVEDGTIRVTTHFRQLTYYVNGQIDAPQGRQKNQKQREQ